MSKLLTSVLDKISEDNNGYRADLRDLNKVIDERTTTLVGDVVTLSNYTADFSSLVVNAKEKLVNPISRVIESYVIKDLRSVETVNEQFIDKINDKIENSNVNSEDDKNNFIQNLNSLLTDKYLDIIKIKRTDFLNDEKVNNDVETYVNDFVSYLKTIASFDDEKLNDLILSYKVNLYNEIVKTLSKISDLYLNNFVSEVSSALNSVLDINDLGDDKYARSDTLNSFVPEMEIPIVPNIPEIPEVPDAPDVFQNDVETLDGYKETEEIKDDEVSIVTPEAIIPDVPDVPNVPDVALDTEEVKPMDVPNVAPIEMESDRKSADVKKTYDVEEILKIAKSPVVTMPVNEPQVKEGYLSVSPIESSQEAETFDSEFDESEIVEEMIRRLTKRLDVIKERQEKYDAEEQKLKDDEAFVNDLIQSSNAKREELDKFEEELDAKEKEIDEKQRELEKKINDVLPFADAVMKTSEEEA